MHHDDELVVMLKVSKAYTCILGGSGLILNNDVSPPTSKVREMLGWGEAGLLPYQLLMSILRFSGIYFITCTGENYLMRNWLTMLKVYLMLPIWSCEPKAGGRSKLCRINKHYI